VESAQLHFRRRPGPERREDQHAIRLHVGVQFVEDQVDVGQIL
jgi:hypothetical protein